MNQIALITGANRGLGLATAQKLLTQGFHVVCTARNIQSMESQIPLLKKSGSTFDIRPLDVAKTESIPEFCQNFLKDYKNLHVLINNAGIYADKEDGGEKSVFNSTKEVMLKTFKTNTLAPFLMIQGLIPQMLQQNFGRIVNVSSGMGELTDMRGQYLAYRVSKTALNAVTRVFSNELEGKDILINSVCPGWVRTDMGGPQATRTLEEGIAGIVWAATLPKGGPSGGFFRDGKPLNW